MRDEKGRFIKGHQLTFEENQKSLEKFKDSWKKRENYIGDLKKKSPYIYNSWRGLMFTEKGKKIGITEDWKDFRTFFNDVYPTYVEGYTLQRKDKNNIFSKENFIWVSRSDAAIINQGMMSLLLECDGETLTLYEWANKLHKNYSSLRARYSKYKDKLSIKEILYGKQIKRGVKKTSDWKYAKDKLRIKASKMISQYKLRDRKRGMDICDFNIEWFVENIMTQKCVYCGDTEEIGADRIDNNIGHIKSNIVPCCKICNHARNNNFTHEEMLEIGKVIAEIKSKRKKEIIEEKHSIDELYDYQKRNYDPFIYQYDKDLNLIYEYDSIDEAVDKTKYKKEFILAACRGQRHDTHRYMGYLWFYEKQ